MSDFLGLHPIGLPAGTATSVSLGGLTAGQVAALAGTSGAPSGSNPYVTSTDARLAPQIIPASPGTYLFSGASVTWVTGFQFLLGAAVYYINGVQYTSAQQTVTLTAADGANDRIDVLTLDTNGTAGKVTGTAASPPAEPAVDQATLLGLGIVYVAASATSPGVTTTAIYTENAEWTGSASAGTIVTNSATAPRTGSVCVVGTAVAAGTTLTFTKPSTNVDLAQFGILVMYVKITAAWAATKSITCRWLAGAATVGVDVPVGDGQYGLNTQVVGTYQQVVVPLSTFAVPAGTAVTKLRLTFAGTGTVGFSMDDISIQTGTGTTSAPAQFRWRGAWSAATAYAQNDAVTNNGASYFALQGGTNQTPGAAASAYWAIMGGYLTTVPFTIDGGGVAITTGIKGDVEIPFAGTIVAVRTLADQSGSIVVDLWKDTYANYPPTIADTITASAKPTISTATKAQDTTLTGWTVTVAAGDIIRFNVDSITTCTRVLVSLTIRRI